MADRDEEAETRTELAEDRTILANERTFAGWIRMSLGCIALGAGFQALFQKMEPPWVPKAIATGFLLLAVIIATMAERRAATVTAKLDPHTVAAARKVNLRFIALAVSAGALALAGAIWLLRFES